MEKYVIGKATDKGYFVTNCNYGDGPMGRMLRVSYAGTLQQCLDYIFDKEAEEPKKNEPNYERS